MTNLNTEQKEVVKLDNYDSYYSPRISSYMVPNVIYDYAEVSAQECQQPLNYIITSTIIALASLIGNRAVLQVNAQTIKPLVWGLLIGRSGVGKTPSIKLGCKFISSIEKENRKKAQEENKNIDNHNSMIQTKIKVQYSKLAKAEANDENTDDVQKRIVELNDKLLRNSYERQIIENSITKEALIKSLIDNNPNGVMVYNDEIYGFFNRLDKSDNCDEKPFYNSIYSSDEYRHKTISRGVDYIPEPFVNILGGIQPEKLFSIAKRYDDSGLLPRFQLITFEKPLKRKSFNIKAEAKLPVEELNLSLVFDKINNLKYTQDILNGEFIKTAGMSVRYSEDAFKIYNNWHTKIEDEKFDINISDNMQSHLVKANDAFHSLCLIFHLVESSNDSLVISKEIATKVTKLMSFFIEQATHLYGEAPYNLNNKAIELLQRYEKLQDLQSKHQYINVRYIQQRGWAGLKDKEIIIDVLEYLYEAGYLQRIGEAKKHRYILNPNIPKDYLQSLQNKK